MAGIDAKNKHIMDQKYICPVCSFILRDPVQLGTCGHRVCQLCSNSETRKTILCPICHVEVDRDEVSPDRGFKNDMQSLPIDCSFCQWTGILNNYQKHLDESHSHPKCEFCGEEFDSVDKLNEHKVKECKRITVYCILKEFGCVEPILRDQLKEHYLTQQHQDIVIKLVRQYKSQLVESGMNVDLPATTTTAISDPATAEVLELYETLNILSGGIEALADDGQRVNNEWVQMQMKVQALQEDLSKVKLSVEESHGFLQGVKYNQDVLNQDLISLKEQIDDMKYVSYDGTFIWKITNFRENMMDAQSERQTSIYSPPFYSSPTGYKMRARLYLQGDGNARRTHMSLFFVLMRGVNDPILKFPFNYKVTFCLYDQTGANSHIIDSFRPDIKSNSFQRPRSDMNIASGIPKFFPLSMIEQENNPYVQDDTMFIKVLVDFGDMPKTLLPYAITLNPAIPLAVQHELIKVEAERRAQEQQQLDQNRQQTPVT